MTKLVNDKDLSSRDFDDVKNIPWYSSFKGTTEMIKIANCGRSTLWLQDGALLEPRLLQLLTPTSSATSTSSNIDMKWKALNE